MLLPKGCGVFPLEKSGCLRAYEHAHSPLLVDGSLVGKKIDPLEDGDGIYLVEVDQLAVGGNLLVGHDGSTEDVSLNTFFDLQEDRTLIVQMCLHVATLPCLIAVRALALLVL
jgi:hypothetical protein